MITLREFSYSKDLGLNLRSVVDAPSIGRQTFTVTEINRTDPEPKWFATPEGYTVRDLRESTPPARD
ncbi:hypothetical protein [Terriglobus sp.]|uniref:hypothetical protein n=1 Tax=Terriglobus sp. TaxID=1889013 RepID=UPI003AFFFE55